MNIVYVFPEEVPDRFLYLWCSELAGSLARRCCKLSCSCVCVCVRRVFNPKHGGRCSMRVAVSFCCECTLYSEFYYNKHVLTLSSEFDFISSRSGGRP